MTERPSPPAGRRGVPGSLASRYEDIRFVGEGGMGTVYRGLDPRLGRLVALKLIKGDDPALSRRFIQEAKAQARIQHEHVCRVYEAGEADGEPYIAMQYIGGEPLSRMKERLTVEQRVKLMQEVSTAVHEAHRLGMIHRDIKPGNILVETHEDGGLKPYIMDFGLAREVEAKGETMTGAVVGTPMYMPPEQARGEIRAMDRRSDVYSLGATLYDVLSGRPPFVAEHPWQLLVQAAYEEPPSLGKVKKGLPAELETIVMKCLERDPARRYDSARALADDLQRYLDGEPILARRASVPYVLWKKAKKHKLVAALSGAMLAGGLVFTGVWVNARREAAERARLAHELGEKVKEMELFLRASYTLPLHDVERERAAVRKRLGRIEQTMTAAGRAAEGPGHYALGRGYLALGDPRAAEEHMQKARAAGYSSAELDYARGRALGELYKRALEETHRIADREERQRKEAEVGAALRDPALVHLRAAVGAEIEVPAYAEGLIALYQGKSEEALAKAKEAFEEAPWLYEAKKLEGDAHHALGSRFRDDAAFDFDKMMTHFGPAAEAYRVAADMARSDPDVHRAECELWTQIAVSTAMKGNNPRPPFEKADLACGKAIDASPQEGRARTQRAIAYQMLANSLAKSVVAVKGSEDVRQVIDRALSCAEEAVQVSPDDVMARYTLAATLETLMFFEKNMGVDARGANARAIAAYETVLRLDGRFLAGYNGLAEMYSKRALMDVWSGVDASISAQEAMAKAERAIRITPSDAKAWGVMAGVQYTVAEQLVEQGKSPEPWLSRSLAAVAKIPGNHPYKATLASWAHTLAAHRAIDTGADPRGSLELSARQVAEARRLAPGSPLADYPDGRLAIAEARFLLREGKDPGAPVDRARTVLDHMISIIPHDLDGRLTRAGVELFALRWAMGQQRATAGMFDAAFAPLRPLLAEGIADPHFYQLLAEAHAMRAEWLAGRRENPDQDIIDGLATADKALARNPHLATAFAAKGRLHLVQARAAPAGGARAEAARRAKEAFASASREDPLLEREHGEALKEIAGVR